MQRRPTGICKLCCQERLLAKSHAIPDAVFRSIKKTGAGKAIQISNSDEPNKHTQDSFWTYQLCEDCEDFLNRSYDQYGLKVLKGEVGQARREKIGVIFRGVNTGRLINFFCSVYWRAARSEHPQYKKVSVTKELETLLKEKIISRNCVPIHKMGVRISRLRDPNTNGFSDADLRQISISPFPRIDSRETISFCFLFSGFFVEVFIQGVSPQKRRQLGWINPSMNRFIAPYTSPFNIPELQDLMVSAYVKEENGNSHIQH